MAETTRAGGSNGRASSFDVRGWIAGVGHISKDVVQFVSESERGGRRTVTYNCAGAVAKVRMAPVAGAAAWELTAEFNDSVDRVLLPRTTRFVWRAPRGTHA